MNRRLADVTAFLDTCRTDVYAAVGDPWSPQLEVRPAGGGWSAAHVIAHLALVESRTSLYLSRQLAAAVAAGIPREQDDSPLVDTLGERVADPRPLVAPEMVRPPEVVTAGDALAALHASRKELRATLAAADGWALGEVATRHPLLGALDMYRSLFFIGHHDRRHAAQIRRILAGVH